MKTDYREYLWNTFVVPPFGQTEMTPLDDNMLPLPTTVDMDNVIFQIGDREMKERLKDLWNMPKMSTFAIASLINLIVSELPEDETFVNVGVWHGYTFVCVPKKGV